MGHANPPLISCDARTVGGIGKAVNLGGGFLVGTGSVGGFGWGVFLDAFEHLGQGGLVHGGEAFGADALEQAGDGWVIEYEPIIFGGDVDVAEADLLGGELELSAAVRSFALLDEALLVQEQETPANHYSAFCERFRNLRRGVHGGRF